LQDITTLIITVAVLTCRRPEPLRRLLESLSQLLIPPNSNVSFIIIDNDPVQSALSVVMGSQPRLNGLKYVHEPRPGIPIARSRAVDEVVAISSDFMAFTDDDEVVDPNWLCELVEVQIATGADLVGGPELCLPNVDKLPLWNRFIEAGVIQRADQKAKKAEKQAKTKNKHVVLTHNWFCRVTQLRDSNLRFDVSCTQSGGSDTVFFHQAKTLGWTTAWAPKAIVREILTPDRLTLTYQFNRGRGQSVANFLRKKKPSGLRSIIGVYFSAFFRIMAGLFLFVIPVKGVASPIIAVRSMGWAIGRIQALFGGKGMLYRDTVNESVRLNSPNQLG
jgi:succinoglycan biosynthesis protein ExoM